MKPEEFFSVLLKGIEKTGEIFNSFQDKDPVRVAIPRRM